MRILYVNHTGEVSGAERSLLTLLGNLPPEVSPYLAAPPGPLQEAASGEGIPVLDLPPVRGSLKLHPLHTARGIADIAASAWVARRLARRVKADLIHANTIRAGLTVIPASRSGGPPAVVHMHDNLPANLLSSPVLRIIRAGASEIMACSDYVAEQVATGRGGASLRVVYNPVDTELFDPSRVDRPAARESLGLAPDEVALGVVAQVTPWKAQDDALRILARLAKKNPQVRLFLVGSPKFTTGATRYDNLAFARGLERLVDELQVRPRVTSLGEQRDIPRILRALDVLLVPSWEEPFGMAMIEGMAMALPVAATTRGGTSEILEHGEVGLLLPPRRPELWADALEPVVGDRELRERLGRRGREVVKARLGAPMYARRIADAYAELLSRRPRR